MQIITDKAGRHKKMSNIFRTVKLVQEFKEIVI